MDVIKVINLILCTILLIIGVIGNTLVITVYGRKSHLSRVKVLIILLAINDLIGSGAVFSKSIYDFYYTSPGRIGALDGDLPGLFQYEFTVLSLVLLTVVMIDRYDSIKNLRAYNAYNSKQSIKIVVFLSLTTFFFLSLMYCLIHKVATTTLHKAILLSNVIVLFAALMVVFIIKTIQIVFLVRKRSRISPLQLTTHNVPKPDETAVQIISQDDSASQPTEQTYERFNTCSILKPGVHSAPVLEMTMITLPGHVEIPEDLETSDRDQDKHGTNYVAQQNPLFPGAVEHPSLSSPKLEPTTNSQPNLGQLTLDQINVAFEEAAECESQTTLQEQPHGMRAEYNHPTVLVPKHSEDQITPQLPLSIAQDDSTVECNEEETRSSPQLPTTAPQQSLRLPQQLLLPQKLSIQPQPLCPTHLPLEQVESPSQQAVPPSQANLPVSADQEKQRSGGHPQDALIYSHVTKMLLTVSTIFLCTTVPSLIARVIYAIYSQVLQQDVHLVHPAMVYIFTFFMQLKNVNFATNPLVYLMNPSFRQDLASLLSHIKRSITSYTCSRY